MSSVITLRLSDERLAQLEELLHELDERLELVRLLAEATEKTTSDR